MMNIKYFAAGLILAMLTAVSVFSAADKLTDIPVVRNSVKVFANDKEIQLDTFLFEGKQYVPLREIAEQLGQTVYWNAEKNSAHVTTIRRYTVADEDYSLFGIPLGMKIDELLALKGEPLEIVTGFEPTVNRKGLKYVYEGYDVFCMGDHVTAAVIYGENIPTERDVKIGDDKDWVISQYGLSPDATTSYTSKGSYHALYFELDENDKVSRMTVGIILI